MACLQVYSVTLHGEQLRTDFRVLNTDDKPFEFTAALHSYFEVLHVDQAKVGHRHQQGQRYPPSGGGGLGWLARSRPSTLW